MKRTDGPWGLRGYQIRANGGHGAHVATYQISAADGIAIAAVPELLDFLDRACGALDMAERGSFSSSLADDIRERLGALGIWELSDKGPRHDPASLNPDVDTPRATKGGR